MKRPFCVPGGLLILLVAASVDVRAAIPGTGSLTGRVSAEQPFQVAKVYMRNARLHMTYVTYTNEGRYTAINLLPGAYAVTVEKEGFGSDTQQVVIENDKTAVADFTLRHAAASAAITNVGAAVPDAPAGVVEATYEEIYPPGPGLEIIEGTCIACHGVNWIPARPNSEAGWNAMLDLMLNLTSEAAFWGIDSSPLIPEGTIDEAKRAKILAYLTRHFGPGKPVRRVRVDLQIPLDEAALSQALWVEYSVAEPKAANGNHRWIQEPYFDTQGNVWLTERTRGASAILKLDPRTASFSSYPITNPQWSPHGIIVDPVDGQVWWAGQGVYLSRLNPETGRSKDYTFPSEVGGYGGHTPVLDSKGNIWFTMLPDDRIGKWDRKTDSIETWKNPTVGGRPYGILVDQDDKVWYVQWYGCKITRFDPVTETFSEFSPPSAPCTIRRLGLDAQGKIWYGVFNGGKLGVLDPLTGEMREHSIGRFAEPYDTWADPQDNIWVGDGGRGGFLIRFDQKTERFTHYPSPQPSDMPKLAITREGAIWYSNRSSATSGAFPATVGVLYPDMSSMKTFAAYYEVRNGKPVGSGSPMPALRKSAEAKVQ